MDLAKYHSGVVEFDERNRRRRLKHLAKFHSLGLDRPDQTVQRPWANLGDGQLRPETGGDGWRPAAGSAAGSSLAGCDFRGRQTPVPPRRVLGTPAPPRSPPAGAGYVPVPLPPPTASSRLSTATPPRTSSTTLSTLWRRALSTPALGTIDEAGALAAASMGTNRGVALGSRADEDWWGATEAIPKEELVRLVEHVHAKVLCERRRRKDVEGQLAQRSLDAPPRRRPGASDGSSQRPPPSRGSP